MKESKPKVSCLMLTYNRFEYFKLAVQNFIDQTYPIKELVIVNSGNWLYKFRVKKFLAGIVGHNIKHLEVDKLSLGELRNIGIRNSQGDFITIFDDDDYHHPERISTQIDICLKSNVDGTFLKNFIATYKDKRAMTYIRHGLEGTLLFKNPGDWIKYDSINQGEDTAFKKSLKDKGYTLIVLDAPHELYEYRFHGGNTVSKKHFKAIAKNEELFQTH